MQEISSCNYFDLFGLDSKLNRVARLDISIDGDFYPEGFVFEEGKKYSGFEISKYIDDIPLVYILNHNHVQLHMFVPNGTTKNISCNVKPEKKLYRYGEKKWIEKAFEEGSFLIRSAISYILDENNKARKDNEHIFESTISKKLNPYIILEDGRTRAIHSDMDLTRTDRDVNKFILCMSYGYDESLYGEFWR